jgi:hypothetical protein
VKYRQRGYQDDDRDEERKPKQERPPWRDPDLPGGRLAQPQRAIRVLRCHRCGQSLPLEQDARGDILPIARDVTCGNCSTAVHACRNCVHFDPEKHLECRKPIKVRLRKDAANDCEWFEPKVAVEMTRDESRPEGSFAQTPTSSSPAPRSAHDAREAFEKLFTK